MGRWAALFVFLFAAHASAQHDWGKRTDGKPVTHLAEPGNKAVVLFFVASDCPVSNRTFPEMQRLRREFASSSVTFWYVYPNGSETSESVASHQASFDSGGTAILSPGPDLVRLAHAVATPEIAILGSDNQGDWRPVYTGRIDDHFVRFGQERSQVTEHYGERAIQAVLAGKAPAAPVGTPVGCAIMNPGVGKQ